MSKKTLMAAAVAVALMTTAGCATKQQTGAVVGAGIGGIACNLLAKNSGSTMRAIITAGCATAGGLVGSKIGAMLDERDKVALSKQKEEILASSKPGAKTTWKSEHSGATATIETTRQFTQVKATEVKRVAAVQKAPSDMELIQAPYVTLKGTNVRAAPSANAEKVGGLTQGTEFTAIGKTGDWILVGRKGVNVGYIHRDLVSPKEAVAARQTMVAAKTKLDEVDTSKPETKQFAVTREEVVASVEKPQENQKTSSKKEVSGVFDLGKETKKPDATGDAVKAELAPTIVSDKVVAKSTCKEVQVKVSAAGKTETSRDAYCQSGSGFENISI